MYEILKQELEKDNVFNGELPQVITDLANSIENHKIPHRMKIAIAVSEFILFFSQFQKKIKLYDETLLPINGITFVVSGSGSGKDSSKSRVRSCFSAAYLAINNKRKQNAKQRAIQAARDEGLDNAEQFDVYKAYYQHPQSLFSAPNSTIEGLVHDFNLLEEEGLGAGYVASGEIGDEMSRGIEELMVFMSEVYDLGQKEVKALRNKDNQLKPIKNFPVNALFMGSQAAILYEQHIKDKFKKAFSSKLARRIFFTYVPYENKRPEMTSIEQFDEWVANNKRLARESKEKASIAITAVGDNLLRDFTSVLPMSKDVERIYGRYMAYNEEVAEQLEHQFPISKLVRLHLQWKALKFSGAIAMFNGHKEITKSDFISAISYCEMLSKDMEEFEIELAKQPHEVFSDKINSIAEKGKAQMTFHTIQKLGYIPTTGNAKQHVASLIQLASSYDEDGIYTMCEDGVCFEKQIKTDIIGVSYLEVDNTEINQLITNKASSKDIENAKHRVAMTTTYGYKHLNTTFEDLAEMLKEDFAYTPFTLRKADEDAIYDTEKHPKAIGGVRGKENVLGGCKWIVLDVDHSTITAQECHLLLSDINHHIALTSDPENMNKFRVLIELDSVVDIPDLHWKAFIAHISEYLAINSDPLPKSQIFFSYADRLILSTVDAAPLETKQFIIQASETVNSKERPKKITKAQGKTLLNDPLGTFFYAYEASDGEGSRSMIRAALHAKDLGATYDETIDLMYDINNYWSYPMDTTRFERTILQYVERIYQ